MALLNWSDQYSVGVKALDDQHKVLVNTLNDLHAAIMKGQASNITGSLLTQLVKYTRDHFAAEEAIMTRTKFAGFAAHRAKHLDLTRQVEDYVASYQRGEITLNLNLLNFLRDWLMTHILKEDMEYRGWFNANGVH